MASHPYISGAGNITQMIGFLRKNFPATVNSDTVKKLGLASKNESYVINALQFLGLIDEEGKRTAKGQEVMTTHDQTAFQAAFEVLVKEAYKDLFELRADDSWTLNRDELISYFRSADKTSEVIGTRQAGVFIALRALAGHEQVSVSAKPKTNMVKTKSSSTTKSKEKPAKGQEESAVNKPDNAGKLDADKAGIALTVRIEINLPAEGTQETYELNLQEHQGKPLSMSVLDAFEAIVRRAKNVGVEASEAPTIHPFDERNVHPEIAGVALKLFDNGHYSQATFEAFKYVDIVVKELSGMSDSGFKLMMSAFDENKPKIQLTDMATASDKDEQLGFRHMLAGSMSAIRNPRGHDINTDPIDRCLDHLSVASVLLRRIGDRKLPAPPKP